MHRVIQMMDYRGLREQRYASYSVYNRMRRGERGGSMNTTSVGMMYRQYECTRVECAMGLEGDGDGGEGT